MPAQENIAAVCPDCGTRMETTTSGDLGCRVCLLRVGLDDALESNEADGASVPLPDQFGSYVIERREDGSPWELGRGAMGVTYRAVDTSLQRSVALKIINTDLVSRSAEAQERFIREARLAASLRHPNVATVHHFGVREETGQCFCAMELVEGETLDDRVRRMGPLEVRTVVEIACQIAGALVAAEKRGLVHRDLKPANVMIASSEESDSIAVKVIDFGVAKTLAETPDARVLTQTGFIGTPAFASPEQFTNGPVDTRSDIYSLGATLWYLLTGHIPFSGRSREEIRSSQESAPLPIEQLRSARVPGRLARLLVAMLALEPAARPSGRELGAQLEECRAQIRDRWKTARQFALTAGLIGMAAAAFILFPRWQKRATSASAPEKSIAVLPFENRSEDKANTYFADGIQDEILTRLAKIGDLKVISRTSTEKYRSRPVNLKMVAEELGVTALLEGSVQKSGGKVRVTVQLIEAWSDHHLWAETYDRPLDDVFTVQSEIAGRVASALHASLTPQEAVALKSVPTRNQKAYDLFLRAEHFLRIGHENLAGATLPTAIDLYRQAVAEDPRFALAYAQLSFAESLLRWLGAAPADVSSDQERIDAEKALVLQPDLMEGHRALAYCDFWGRLDYPSALEHLDRAQALAPQNAEVLLALGAVYRRQLRFDEAIAVYERAAQYDPGNSKLFQHLATTCWWAERNDNVQAPLERALALDPNNDLAAKMLGEFLIWQRGDVEGARRMLRDRGPGLQINLANTYWLTRDYEEAIRLMEELPAEDAAYGLREVDDDLFGLALHWAGHDQRARPLLEPTRDRLIALLADNTLSARALAFNSIHLARIELALGNRDGAVQVAERGAQSDGVTRDLIFRYYYRAWSAAIYAQAGRNGEAIALISGLLKSRSGFTGITPIMLCLAPTWDPLRKDPRFQALLKEYPAQENEKVVRQ